MALVKCKECGKEISSAAKICPNCGVPEPGIYTPCLVSIHRKPAIKAIAAIAKIYVDNECVGEIRNDDTIAFEVVPGERTIGVRGSLGGPYREYSIVFSAGNKCSLEIEPEFWGGGFKVDTK